MALERKVKSFLSLLLSISIIALMRIATVAPPLFMIVADMASGLVEIRADSKREGIRMP